MSSPSQFSQWAQKVATQARNNEKAPALFWEGLRKSIQEDVHSLNAVFHSEEVQYTYDEEFSVRAQYNNRVLTIAVDLTTGRLDYHINVTSSDMALMEEVFRGHIRVRLQPGSQEAIKAEEASVEAFGWLTAQSLRRWPLHARMSQYLLQKLVAPELNDIEFTRP